MTLETLDPDADADAVDADEFDPAVLDALAADDYRFKVWGGDWCIDCQRQLPAFGAALAAAGVPDDRIEAFPVTKGPNGKEGEGVDEYEIELIPTVVVETAAGEEGGAVRRGRRRYQSPSTSQASLRAWTFEFEGEVVKSASPGGGVIDNWWRARSVPRQAVVHNWMLRASSVHVNNRWRDRDR